MNNSQAITNAMSVDVEDYYQVAAFDTIANRKNWHTFESRVEYSTNKVLDLFAKHDVKGTFFILGCVAEKHPELVKRIAAEHHEVASHGMYHQKVTEMTSLEFYSDIKKSKELLESISGQAVKGYRAPSYSISKNNLWAHNELVNAGYQYSSSVYPVKHDLYGIPDAPRFAYRPAYANQLLEIPITTWPILSRNIPIGGGGYFRLFPYALYRKLVKQFHQAEQQSTMFYFHPWEVDPDQPRPKGLPLKSKFRHYLNLTKMESRLSQLIEEFRWNRIDHIFLGK